MPLVVVFERQRSSTNTNADYFDLSTRVRVYICLYRSLNMTDKAQA